MLHWRMDSAWIGVVGAAVGALAGYPVQSLLARRADSAAKAQALRADQVAAYSAFAERVMDWRRSQVVRGMLTIEGPGPPQVDEGVRDENRRVRAAAWTAFYRVKLLCDDPEIQRKARDVIETTRDMKRAQDRRTLNAKVDDVRLKLDIFLDSAAEQTLAESSPAQRAVRRSGPDS